MINYKLVEAAYKKQYKLAGKKNWYESLNKLADNKTSNMKGKKI